MSDCVFIESLAPTFANPDENPNGVDRATMDTVRQAILDDRPAWLPGYSATSSTSTSTSGSIRRATAVGGSVAIVFAIGEPSTRRGLESLPEQPIS